MRLLFVLIFVSLKITAQTITWAPPAGFASGSFYQVKVNGVEIPVFDTPIASYALVDFKGSADVEVQTKFDVRWVDIRPSKLAIQPKYTGNHSFSFKLDNPSKISIELNGRIRQQPLFLFASLPETNVPSSSDKNTIIFSKGKIYKDVKLELTDNATVYIEGGAVVQGYLFAKNKKNIKIYGRGIMDGSFNKNTPGNENRFLHFEDCEDISIEGITLHNGTTWQIAAFHSRNINVKNVRIVSENGSDDGIDIFRCRDVIVDDIFAHTKDDCVAIKSGGNYPADHPTDNIVVKNSVFWNSIWGNAIEIGFELYSTEVKNILFKNIDIIHVEDGAAMSIHNAGQAHVYNVTFEDIRVEDTRQKLFDVAIFFSQWGPDGIRDQDFISKNYLHGAWDGVQKIPEGKEDYHRNFRGKVSNVIFKDIYVTGHLPFSVFHGFDAERNVSGISIINLRHNGKKITTPSEAKIRTTHTSGLVIR